MRFSATRLTCFALISSLEEDLRIAIEDHLADLAIQHALPPDRITRAQARRQSDNLPPASALPVLLPYLDFADSYELLMAQKRSLPEDLTAALTAIAPDISRLIAIRNRVAHTRPMEIDDTAHLLDIADTVLSRGKSNWDTLSETIRRLTSDPSYVLGLTISLPMDPDNAPQHNLPIPDFDETGFFGRQDELRRIKKAIKGAYPVVSVLGDGGIGKTSIALKAAYELLEDPAQPFEAIIWVSAKATILTTNEIQRITGSIESSIGLLAAAASELGGATTGEPIAEVLAYLENFKILLLLDNLETVLDERLRGFLLDLPLGSKVIITSRVGLGIENPVQLEPLSIDDSARLLRALSRVRNVRQLRSLPQGAIESLAQKMSGHPAYIKWFVAGVQAGKRPEELIGDNALLLEFCMSNVYEYLEPDARTVVRSMQVLPGARNQAELAFLNKFPAKRIQSALLKLLTTNFVQMSSQSSAQTLETLYQLSDFAKQYLDKHHPVSHDKRNWLLKRSQELRELGSDLAAVSSARPYAPDAVVVRNAGDVHVGRLLRDAIRQAAEAPTAALTLCSEAQVLAPGYYEAWRVEAHIRTVMHDHAGAYVAYERALELAPDSPAVHFHFGAFLLNEAGEPRKGLEILQAGARLDAASIGLAGQIAWAHYCLSDMAAAVDASRHVVSMEGASQLDVKAAGIVALRAASHGARALLDSSQYEQAAEVIEACLELSESVHVEALVGESSDRLIQLATLALELANAAEGYSASKAKEYWRRLQERLRRVEPANTTRITGTLKTVKADKWFGFITAQRKDYFFHYRDLVNSREWELLTDGITCAFEPENTHRGLRAKELRVLT